MVDTLVSRILVVDDEENIRDMFRRALLKSGFIVHVAGTGREALAMFKQASYDVVLADIRMPGMDGIELLKKIKTDKESANVIMITGYGTIETAVDAMKLGACDFITKPILEVDSLRLKVEHSLENSSLRRKLATLEEVNRMKDEFLSIVSHELRTPLTPLKASIDMLLDGVLGPLNDDQNEILQISEKEINHLLTIITNLLLTAELQDTNSIPALETVVVGELIQEVIDYLEIQIRDNKVNVSNLIDSHGGTVRGNAYMLKQVFINLLDNAVKFNKKGGKITISMSEQNGNLCYRIKDTGVGIKREDYDRIFDKFQQVDGSMTRKFGGVGLGLAISKKIVMDHGGEITVKSIIGKGSEFRIFLPTATEKCAV